MKAECGSCGRDGKGCGPPRSFCTHVGRHTFRKQWGLERVLGRSAETSPWCRQGVCVSFETCDARQAVTIAVVLLSLCGQARATATSAYTRSLNNTHPDPHRRCAMAMPEQAIS